MFSYTVLSRGDFALSEHDQAFKKTEHLTQWVRRLLYAQVVVAVLFIITGYLEYQVLMDYKNNTYVSQSSAEASVETNEQRQSTIMLLYIAVSISSAIFILQWIYRVSYNARQMTEKPTRFTPGWSVGYYFIPILSLWKPYQAMKETWRISKNPSNWPSEKTDNILVIWWTAFIVSGLLGNAIFKLAPEANSIEDFITLNSISQLSNLVSIGLALSFLKIVNCIHHWQAQHQTQGVVPSKMTEVDF